MKLPPSEPKKARIEIIPMIDAIFFLLVFFMMTSLAMVQLDSKKVELPTSRAPQVKLQGQKAVVTVTKEGALFVGQTPVKEAELVPALAQQIGKYPELTVILNCDRDQDIAQFTRVFDLVKQANPASVMLAATPVQVGEVPNS